MSFLSVFQLFPHLVVETAISQANLQTYKCELLLYCLAMWAFVLIGN